MPRPCSVCSHGARDAIDLELVGGDTFAAIAGRHGLHPDALKRHKANHIQVVYAPNAKQAHRACRIKAAMLAELGLEVHLCGNVAMR